MAFVRSFLKIYNHLCAQYEAPVLGECKDFLKMVLSPAVRRLR